MLFVDSEGNEVDRIIGFIPPTEYLLRLKDIVNKRNTLEDYLSRYGRGEISVDIVANIATKYKDRKENVKAAEFYSILVNTYPDPESDLYKNAQFFLASHSFKKGSENALRNYIQNNPNSEFTYDSYRTMIHHYANTEQKEKELEVFKEMLYVFPDNPGALNSYAWRMAEIESNLEDALIKVRKAVMLTESEPKKQAGIIDTEAEVLWKLGRFNEAIEAIQKAIKIEPDNNYYQDQKNKFLESKKTSTDSV